MKLAQKLQGSVSHLELELEKKKAQVDSLECKVSHLETKISELSTDLEAACERIDTQEKIVVELMTLEEGNGEGTNSSSGCEVDYI